MKKYLLLLLTMLCVSIGTWAQTYFGSGENSEDKSYVTINGSNAQFFLKNAFDFPNWFATGDFATTLSSVSGENIKFKSGAGSDNLTLDAISLGESSTLVLTIKDQWNFTSPKATITLNDASHLATWYSDATDGTKNWQLLDCIDLSNLTFAGEAPKITLTSGTITLAADNGKIKGTISNGTSYSDFSTWKNSVENHHFFSNSAYRININADGTSYVEVNGTKATVHSNSETDFATWAETTAGAEWLTGLGVTAYNFDSDAKFETDGASNYVVLNGTTATVTSADALTSLDTWMTTHSANGNNNYLSDITAYNMASSVTTYLTSGSPYITSTSSENTMVVTSSTITVTKDMADFIKWKATNNGKKILAGKTVSFVDCAYTDNDDTDPCTITLSSDGLTATVHATTAGHFEKLFNETVGANSFLDGTTFVFDNASVVDGTDLAVLLTGNKYYIDLFEITTGSSMTVEAIDNVLKPALVSMTNDYRTAKGIILPYNSTLSTSIVCGLNSDYSAKYNNGTYLFSEYTAYFRSAGVATIHAFDPQVQYTPGQAVTEAQAHVEKALSQLNSHSTVTSNVTTYLASTNNTHDLDLSSITGKTTVSISNDEMVFTTHGLANIVATLNTAGDFNNVVTATNIEGTPCERITINGPVISSDMAAVNSFATSNVDSPKVLILSGATGLTTSMLTSITNDNIQYIILPGGWSKSDVTSTASYNGMTNLKAAISSTNLDLVAYIKEAGSLAEARCLATGGTGNPTPTGLVNVTLTGTLNAADIKANSSAYFVTSEGRWQNTGTGSDQLYVGLSAEQTTIKTIDLADAVFVDNEDMNFMKAGLTGITHVDLPTDKSMKSIPAMCFETCQSLTDICIPFNYERIHNAAFLNSDVKHITTTNSAGELIDNGDYTFTLSANIKELGDKPVSPNTTLGVTEYVFSTRTAANITDVYILATDVPKCYANVFPANMCYGNSGFQGGNFPYCREKYRNSEQWFVILRYPSKSSTDLSDADYLEMQKLYTDINKIYSMKEQSGAIDANGAPITWPTFSELIRVWNQATQSKTWNEWETAYNGLHEVNTDASYDSSNYTKEHDADSEGDYDFSDYEGWHQFVLSQATYMETAGTTLEYVQTDRWYTFCFPFSITVDQLQEMLGVPASTETVKYKLYDKNGALIESASPGHKPEARTLNSVERKPGTSGEANQVTFNFTRALVADNSNEYFYWSINDATPASSGVAECGNTELNKAIALRGGLPYIVKPYLPKGVTVNNLGKYLMERFAHKFTEDQACGNLGSDFYEQLGNRGLLTSRFVKPYEKHKIQAYFDKGNNQSGYYKHANNKKYYYAFIGQFWQQDLPRYALYMVNGKWYRYASGNKGYKLDPYKCVIICAPEDDGTEHTTNTAANSGQYRSSSRSHFPTVTKELTVDDIFDSAFYLGFLDGLDDEDFNEGTHSARESNYIFSLDEDIIEYDENGNQVTSIDNLDGEDLKPAISDGKIYNMAGQYVGESPEDLSKGMYIMNGRKFVVK